MIAKNRRKAEPDLCALLDQVEDSIKSSINCMSIGTIQSFYSDSQTADIKLNYKRVNLYIDSSIDKKISDTSDYQLLIRCPVVVLNGGGGYLSFPIAAGDACLVLFNDREIDTWFNGEGTNPPQSSRMHDLNDGIALVGIRSSLNPITYDAGVVKIYFGTGYITIDSSGNIIANGATLNIRNSGNTGYVTIDASGNIVIRGASITVQTPTNSGSVNIDGSGNAIVKATSINVTNYGTTGYMTVDSSGNLVVLGNAVTIKNGANSCNFIIDASGNLSIVGASLSFLGAWQSKSVSSVYQAESDGAVFAYNASHSLAGYTDTSNPPTTERTAGSIGSGGAAGLAMLVRKGHYWKVTEGGTGSTVFWLPFGIA